MSGPAVLAALGAAATAALVVGVVVRPTRQLGPRVQPYAQLARSRLGRSAEVSLLIAHPGGLARNSVGSVFGPLVLRAANSLSKLVDAGGEEVLALRLRQAGFFETSPEQYRMRQLAWAVGAGAVAGLLGAAVAAAAGALLGGAIGLAWGASYWRGRVNSAIKRRTARMRVELYTVAQLLAMLIRTGHGLVQAMRSVVGRTRGAVVDEIAEALRWMAGGMGESEALERLAEDSPEPAAARLYRLLASGIAAGGDLGHALLSVSDELRSARREDVERAATARRGTMLIPTIVVMAPVVLLFILAPLPSIIFGTR
jgi:tight adherence protein C